MNRSAAILSFREMGFCQRRTEEQRHRLNVFLENSVSWTSSLKWAERHNVPGNARGDVESNYSEFHTAALVSKHDTDCNADLIWIMLSENTEQERAMLLWNVKRQTWDNYSVFNNTGKEKSYLIPAQSCRNVLSTKEALFFVMGKFQVRAACFAF